MPDYAITVYHDTRREKKHKVYPVKVRVYCDYKTRLYPLGQTMDLSEDDFKRSYLGEKPDKTLSRNERERLSELKDKIVIELARAKRIAGELKPFRFDKFEKAFLEPSTITKDVFYFYNQTIKELQSEQRIKTASNYDLSLKSIKKYLKDRGRRIDTLPFEAVTVKFLNDYERWMQGKGKSLTTVGIYLRPLRAIFNGAKVDKDLYPFGKNKYEIPGGSNKKKALTKQDLISLYTHFIEEDNPMFKARAFWFFSYLANGMNVRDICDLKYSNINKDRLTFIRSKTKRTTKKAPQLITVIITPLLQQIINKYSNKKTGPNTYLFPVFSPSMDETKKVSACQNFTRFINQHMKKLAKLVGVDENISTYFARHSFSTISVNSGSSLEYVQEALGHGSLATTQRYFAGFDDAKKIQNANNLSGFLLNTPTPENAGQ